MSIAKAFLAIGIAILAAVFVCYGLYVVYEPPKYDSYDRVNCYTKYDCQQSANDCATKFNYNYSDSRINDCQQDVYKSTAYKSCLELQNKCEEDSIKQSSAYTYSRNNFYILFVIGIILIIVGMFLAGFEGISGGLIGGGVLVVLYALVRTFEYWMTFPKYVKLVAIGIVLVILIYFGYKKLEKRSEPQPNSL